jgi:thiosulfate/3-mercaptopyruvate sulfurtransferase
MEFTTLLSVQELYASLGDPNLVILDCRFTLGDGGRGYQDYLRGHIPGAIYAHLDDDLCGSIVPGVTGRHPLPSVDRMAEKFSGWGIDAQVQVVVYDDWPEVGLPVAARLWWMLRYSGHKKVAVLDGGWGKWLSQSYPVQTAVESRPERVFSPNIQPQLLASTDQVDRFRRSQGFCVVDSRSADRYRGENETIDPVAGHIPGAISLPFAGTLSSSGTFHSRDDLRMIYQSGLGKIPAEQVVFYCGSGVTAAVNVLAMAHAGLGDARLYAGSWSEWITDPSRPID